MGALYRIEFPNGKSYIGITSGTAERRFSEHARDSASGKGVCAVNRAIRKYGVSSVRLQTLAIADGWSYLCLIEQRAIEVFGTYARNGYNLTRGGDGFKGHHTAEAKAKIGRASAASKLGTTASPETRAKLSAAHKGMRVSETAKRKLSEALKGRPKSAETKAKLSEAHKGKPKAPEHVAKMAAAKKGTAPVRTAESREKTRIGLLKRGGGVSFNSRLCKWVAYITLRGARKHLGVFETEAGARTARAAALENALAGGTQ